MLPIIHGIMDKKIAAPIDLSGTSTSHDSISDVHLDKNLMEFQTMKAASDTAKVSAIFPCISFCRLIFFSKCIFGRPYLLELQSAAEPFGSIKIAWIFGGRITSERCCDCRIESKNKDIQFCFCFTFNYL